MSTTEGTSEAATTETAAGSKPADTEASAPTTTMPPEPTVEYAVAALVDEPSSPPVPEHPVDVVVQPGGTTALMAVNTVTEETWTPFVYELQSNDVSKKTQLELEAVSEAEVTDLAASSATVVAVGSAITTEGNARTAIWTMEDSTFGVGELAPESMQRSIAVALDSADNPVIVGLSEERQPTQLTSLRRDAKGDWQTTTLLDDATNYTAIGMISSGQTIVLTGSFNRGPDGPVGVVWVSTDGGATFQQVTDGLDGFKTLGRPSFVQNLFLVMAEGRDNDPTKLLQSPDGITWTATDLSLTSEYSFVSTGTARRAAGAIVEYDGRLAIDFSELLSNVALVDLNGNGEIISGADTDSIDVYFDNLPYVLDGHLYLVARSASGFLLASQQPGGWRYGGRSEFGPAAFEASLVRIEDEVLARSALFPDVEYVHGSDYSWRDSLSWNHYADGRWDVVDKARVPSGGTSLAANDNAVLWISSQAADPKDDPEGGPLEATSARLRSLGASEWSEEQLVADGPGGEWLERAVGIGDRFVAVGVAANRSETAERIFTPLIAEYSQAGWALTPSPDGTPPQTRLTDVYASGDGDVLAVGLSDAQGSTGPVFLSRNADGAWAVADPPPGPVEILGGGAGETNISLVARDDAGPSIYRFDNGSFERVDIKFDGDYLATPIELADLDGEQYLIGTSRGVSAPRLAVWKLDGEQATMLEWTDPVTASDLRVDDVEVDRGRILVAGGARGHNLVWELTVP